MVKLRQTTGTVLRSDHTFKFANALGAIDKSGKRRFVKGYVFTIMNENALILHGEIVPDLSHVHAIAAYRVIFQTPNKSCTTWPQAICTDNVGSDAAALTSLCIECFGENHDVDILQVRIVFYLYF